MRAEINNQGPFFGFSTESSDDFQCSGEGSIKLSLAATPVTEAGFFLTSDFSQNNSSEYSDTLFCGRRYRSSFSASNDFNSLRNYSENLISSEDFSIKTPAVFKATKAPVCIEEKGSESNDNTFPFISLKRKRFEAPSSEQNKRRNVNNRNTWPKVNIMDADMVEFELPSYEGSLEGCERVILNSNTTQVLFRLNKFAEGKQHMVWKPIDAYEGREVVIKTFNPLYINENKRANLAKDIMTGYDLLKKRNDVKVPVLFNSETYKTDGYFIWEFIDGKKARLADVKHVIIDMLTNENFIEDFRPDNVIITEDGSLFVIDPSWNGDNIDDSAGARETEISSLIEAWVCPYKADKISGEEYTAFMDEIEKLNLPGVSAIWSIIKARVDAKFYS